MTDRAEEGKRFKQREQHAQRKGPLGLLLAWCTLSTSKGGKLDGQTRVSPSKVRLQPMGKKEWWKGFKERDKGLVDFGSSREDRKQESKALWLRLEVMRPLRDCSTGAGRRC